MTDAEILRTVEAFPLGIQRERYQQLAKKVFELQVLAKSEMSELILLRDILQRVAVSQSEQQLRNSQALARIGNAGV
jgi:hypothetical protein